MSDLKNRALRAFESPWLRLFIDRVVIAVCTKSCQPNISNVLSLPLLISNLEMYPSIFLDCETNDVAIMTGHSRNGQEINNSIL